MNNIRGTSKNPPDLDSSLGNSLYCVLPTLVIIGWRVCVRFRRG